MDVVSGRGEAASRVAGAVALLIPEGRGALSGAAAAIDRRSRGAIAALLRARDFSGKAFETAVLYPRGLRAKRVVLVGLGAERDTAPWLTRVRQAAAVATRRARDLKVRTLALVVPDPPRGVEPARAARVVAEGSVLGHYRHGAYRNDPGPPPLARIEVFGGADVKQAVAQGATMAEATSLARDLAAMPAVDLTPERLAERAREIARATHARVQVFGPAEIERLGMGALLAVGRASVHPPRFIVLERDPGGAKRAAARVPTVVLIGKGVTFDTGGISLKPAADMGRMKADMSGAAAVLAAFSALPALDPPFRVVGLVPAAENMPGGGAYRPGDVLRALDGTTIEVVSTDAEGRLLLADALGYAHRYKPETVVDIATLTGSITIALGAHAGGLFTADESLARELEAAGEAAGERLWRMPLWSDYAAALRSDTADTVNSAGREGGASIAAIFLSRFASGMRWAHLDIAGMSWAHAERPHEPRGPTGFGARLLLEWLSRRSAASGASSGSRPRAGRARRAARSRPPRA